MQLSRLKGRKVNEYLRREGTVWRGKTMTIRWLKRAPRHPNIDPKKPAIYAGAMTSTKLDKSAPKRNRMRRRCREALRTAILNIEKLPTIQLLISPRKASLSCDFGDIKQDIHDFLRHINVST